MLCLAVASEAVILTDAFVVWFVGLFISNVTLGAIISFPLIYFFWVSGILLIRKFYSQNPDIHFSYKDISKPKHILLGLLLLIVATTLLYISWDGLKIYKELSGSINYLGLGLGLANFTAQHIYYFLEVILITMIIAFSQEAGEMLFKRSWIPYGGIILAVLWGLVHIVWHGLSNGMLSTLLALLLGLAFLAMRKNGKFSFLLILLMFVL